MAQMDTATATILITTLCGTLVTVITTLLNYFKEGRAHKWQIEQAEIDRADRERIAKEVKVHTAYAANIVAADSRITAKAITDKLDENTEISIRAFDEANGINKKILAIGEVRRKDGRPDPVVEIARVSKETNELVHDLKHKVDQVVKP